jgi:hypothetical protein
MTDVKTPPRPAKTLPRPAGIGRLGIVAAWISAVCCLPYLFLKVIWAAGVPVGITDRGLLDEPGWAAANWLMAVVELVGVLLVMAITRPWALRLPAWLPLFPAWVGTGLLFPIVADLMLTMLVESSDGDTSGTLGGIRPWVYVLVYTGFAGQGALAIAFGCYVLTGKVIGQCLPRHRNGEFLRFLRTIDRQVPKGLAVRRGVFRSVPELIAAIDEYLKAHNDDPKPFGWTPPPSQSLPRSDGNRRACRTHLILDNYGTHNHPNVKAWLAKHPRFHLHFSLPMKPGRAGTMTHDYKQFVYALQPVPGQSAAGVPEVHAGLVDANGREIAVISRGPHRPVVKQPVSRSPIWTRTGQSRRTTGVW